MDRYHRMNYAYQGRTPPPQLAAMMTHIKDELETGANAHITADLATINNHQPFEGIETVEVGNGTGLHIQGNGSSLVHSKPSGSSYNFLLKDILHCLLASTNLLSINKFYVDNHCFIELTRSSFSVKDTLTGTVLLQGPSENGLYPILFHLFVKQKPQRVPTFLGV